MPEGDGVEQPDTADTTIQSVINLKITKEGPEKASQARSITTRSTSRTRSRPAGSGATAFGVEMHDPLPSA